MNSLCVTCKINQIADSPASALKTKRCIDCYRNAYRKQNLKYKSDPVVKEMLKKPKIKPSKVILDPLPTMLTLRQQGHTYKYIREENDK